MECKNMNNPLIIALLLSSSFIAACNRTVELNNPFDPDVSLTPPSNLQIASITDTSLTLKWNANYKVDGMNQKAASAVVVEESLDGKIYSFLYNLSAADTSGTIRTMFDTTQTYYFRVHAMFGPRTTANSNVVSWCRLSINPYGLSVANVSEIGRTLSWHDTSSLVQIFQIERGTGTFGTFNLIGETSANVTTFHDTTIILTDTTYYYRVRAISKGGTLSFYDTASIFVSFSPPSNLTCNGNSPDSVNIQWVNNSSTLVGTIVEKSADSINFAAVGTVRGSMTTFSDHAVDHSKSYYYRVRNFMQYNKSHYSNIIRAFYGTASTHLVRELANSPGYSHGSLLVSRDGSTVLFCSNDAAITKWDVNTGIRRHTFPQSQNIGRIALSGDGKTLGLMDTSAGSFSLYSSMDGHLIQKIVLPCPVVDMEISNDGSELITTSADSLIRIWSVESGTLLKSIFSNQKSPISIFLTDGGDTLISGGGNSLCFFDWQSGTILKTTMGGYFNKPIFLLPNGLVVNIQSVGLDLEIIDLSTGQAIRTFHNELTYTDSYTSGYLTSDGTTLLIGNDGWICAYNLTPGYPIRTSAFLGGLLVIARIGNGNAIVVKDMNNLFENGNLIIYQMQFRWMDAVSDFYFGY